MLDVKKDIGFAAKFYSPHSSRMKKTIMIVEDDEGLRQQLTKIIETAPDMECSGVFSSAEEALPQIGRNAPDVILMDIKLPKMSGIECLATVKQFAPSVQVIMVTVYKDSERIFQALKAGPTGYLITSSPP